MAEQSLLTVFTSAVGPPLAIAAAGYLLGRWRAVDVEPLSTVTIYVLLPALVFHSLVTMPITGETVLSLVVAMVGFTAATAAVAAAVAHLAGERGSLRDSAALAAAFPNTGNFGIPVATFAFGAVGRTTAVVFVLVQSVLMYTLGAYVLSRGGEAGGRADALKRVLSLPVTYALVAAAGALALDLVPPPDGPVMRTIAMTGDASIPLFLLILGLQLATMTPSTAVRRVTPTVGVKVLVAPVVAVAVALAVGFTNRAAARAFVVLAAGPAAVTPLVLAIELAGDGGSEMAPADYLGTVIVFTLLGCLPVVTGLIFLLRSGVIL